jgi:hypothetical protein
MKTNHRLYPFFALIAVLFFVVGCEQENPVSTFGEAVERVPELQLIDGADNATMHVQYDKEYSYFRITLSNTGNSGIIADGTYASWCLQMELPLETDREYSGVKLYSSERDQTINMLSYIVNNRPRYERLNPGLTWKEIQVAFWVILETKDLQLASIADIIPSAVDGYNAAIVNNILSDVKQNGSNFVPGFGDIKIVVTDANNGEQSNGYESCETAMVRMIDDPEDRTYLFPSHSWFTYLIHKPTEEKATFGFYAAQWYKVGEVDIWKDGDYLYIEVRLAPGYVMNENHVNVQTSLDDYPSPSKTAFGQYPFTAGSIPWNSDWDDEDLYIAVHGVVCGEYPDND